jgi:predicted amidophosphoribosyltransferase
MTVKIVTFSSYLTNAGVAWRSVDYDGLNFIKAIKQHPLSGNYSHIPVGGVLRLLNAETAANASKWFSQMAADYIIAAGVHCPIVLIPVPDSSCVAGEVEPKMAHIADMIAARLNCATVWSGLRWREAHEPSHVTFEKDPRLFYENYVLTERPPAGTLIIVDDMHTTGSHVRSACTVLRDAGRTCKLALCAGKRVSGLLDSPFDVVEEHFEYFNSTLE